MLLRPPTSTLFPTRRSSDLRQRLEKQHLHFNRQGPATDHLPPVRAELLGPRVGGRARQRRSRRFDSRDRKSTRLNSSHLGISYAVFCLKKKTKNQLQRSLDR